VDGDLIFDDTKKSINL